MTVLPCIQPCLLGHPWCMQCICPHCLLAGTWKSYSSTLAAVYSMPSIGVVTMLRFLNVRLETIYMSCFILIPLNYTIVQFISILCILLLLKWSNCLLTCCLYLQWNGLHCSPTCTYSNLWVVLMCLEAKSFILCCAALLRYRVTSRVAFVVSCC